MFSKANLNYRYIRVKSWIDLFTAVFFAILFSPLILLISLLLLIAYGEVFFKQNRPGLNGKIFIVYKFKTMGDQKGVDGELLNDKLRMGFLGKLIRMLSIDELPQLLNVIKGDMSIVGPRPLLTDYLSLYSATQARRHEVKPGITGWAQVNGRNAISWTKKFELDVWYVDNISFMLDMKILFLTVIKVFQSKDISMKGYATMPPFKGTNQC